MKSVMVISLGDPVSRHLIELIMNISTTLNISLILFKLKAMSTHREAAPLLGVADGAGDDQEEESSNS